LWAKRIFGFFRFSSYLFSYTSSSDYNHPHFKRTRFRVFNELIPIHVHFRRDGTRRTLAKSTLYTSVNEHTHTHTHTIILTYSGSSTRNEVRVVTTRRATLGRVFQSIVNGRSNANDGLAFFPPRLLSRASDSKTCVVRSVKIEFETIKWREPTRFVACLLPSQLFVVSSTKSITNCRLPINKNIIWTIRAHVRMTDVVVYLKLFITAWIFRRRVFIDIF